MFTVGLDVDYLESGMVVKLSLITGLFAGNPFSSNLAEPPTVSPRFCEVMSREAHNHEMELGSAGKNANKAAQLINRKAKRRYAHLFADGQSAGSQKRALISSHVPKHHKPLQLDEFGYYLAGLIEGDGCFGDRRLEILFHENDITNAYFVKKAIGFGTVNKIKEKKAVKYVLRHMTGLAKVVNLINGKFQSSNKINQLIKYQYDSIFQINIKPINEYTSCLTNHWLAGFTDANGCFHVSIVNSKTHKCGKCVRLEYKISQKDPTALTS
ncbi:hypothetical protein CLOM_g9324 [Closterium sp. NIES-68]|nr:hypothetical protein CLOM_g20746 [Closterium sp. NIES-68]GJP39487.1 hypothetical protein CLOM_g23851 [Closterium sp. NIES-68]GJP45493.1 hypothetical protein CLOM_g4878 [Closterium sp. NIES-68]GJP47539.1 hypothetical protein CLOM_g6721 [Closterium sp. NIES-68]GJP50180.1 hypothetical protein CLOM_g9324 [Closterium sp. NIES-68]